MLLIEESSPEAGWQQQQEDEQQQQHQQRQQPQQQGVTGTLWAINQQQQEEEDEEEQRRLDDATQETAWYTMSKQAGDASTRSDGVVATQQVNRSTTSKQSGEEANMQTPEPREHRPRPLAVPVDSRQLGFEDHDPVAPGGQPSRLVYESTVSDDGTITWKGTPVHYEETGCGGEGSNNGSGAWAGAPVQYEQTGSGGGAGTRGGTPVQYEQIVSGNVIGAGIRTLAMPRSSMRDTPVHSEPTVSGGGTDTGNRSVAMARPSLPALSISGGGPSVPTANARASVGSPVNIGRGASRGKSPSPTADNYPRVGVDSPRHFHSPGATNSPGESLKATDRDAITAAETERGLDPLDLSFNHVSDQPFDFRTSVAAADASDDEGPDLEPVFKAAFAVASFKAVPCTTSQSAQPDSSLIL